MRYVEEENVIIFKWFILSLGFITSMAISLGGVMNYGDKGRYGRTSSG